MQQLRNTILILLLLSSCVVAQENKSLSLDEAIKITLSHNPNIEIAGMQRVIDKFSLKTAYDQFQPHYGLSANYVKENGDNSFNFTPNFTIKTPIGTTVNISNQIGHEHDFINSNVTNVSVMQPLLKGSSYALNTAGLDNAIDQEKLNRLNYGQKIADIIIALQQQYFQVLQDKQQQQIYQLSLQRSEDALKEYKIRVKAGKIPESSITQQQSQITTNKLQLELNKAALARDYSNLLLLMGLDYKTQYHLDDNVDTSKITIPNLNDAIKQAKIGNRNYLQQKIQLGSIKRNVLIAKDDLSWQLDLNANWNSNGDKSTAISANINLNDMPAKLNLATAENNLKQANIELQESEKHLEVEVANLRNNLLLQQKEIELAELNVRFSEQNYNNSLQSQLHGRASSYEVVAQHQSYLQAQIDLINYKINFYSAYSSFINYLGIVLLVYH